MHPIIRPLRPQDLPILVELCIDHAAYERSAYDPAGKVDALAKLLFTPDARLECLVVEEQGVLVGYASFSVECSTWDAEHYMHMDCLFLRPEARNKGIGRRLMAAIAQRALRAGITRMQWQTPSFNVDAIRFYDRLGPAKKEKFRYFMEEGAVRALAEA
jgi:GNAT superfamily N-acetyltransferase